MQAWVIFNASNNDAIYIRETSQAVCEAAEQMGKLAILSDDEHPPSDAEGIIVVPEFDGDSLTVKVFLAGQRERPYMYVKALMFDSSAPIEDW